MISLMISWVKRNKLTSALLLIVLYFLVKSFLNSRVTPLYNMSAPSVGIGGAGELSLKSSALMGRSILPSPDYTPTQTTDRLVVQESNMSLVVKNVRESVDKATQYATDNAGYMVSSSLSQPEDAPYASLTLRIPAKNLTQALNYFRSLSIKVSSENLTGHDVTDRYVDIQARLDTLNMTKTKFEEIMTKATAVTDILTVQRELINVQDQIDSLKGQQQYLEKTAELAKITMYFSTDEFALPYAPSQPFRPEAIFKQAVRSLVLTLRGVVQAAIWIVVYSIVWLPILAIVWFLSRRKKTS